MICSLQQRQILDEKKLKALAAELAKGLKTEADLNQFSRMLTKLTVETALNAELTDHLGHEKNAPKTLRKSTTVRELAKHHFPLLRAGSRYRGITQYIEENTTDRVAHVVVTELRAGWKGSKIRNYPAVQSAISEPDALFFFDIIANRC